MTQEQLQTYLLWVSVFSFALAAMNVFLAIKKNVVRRYAMAASNFAMACAVLSYRQLGPSWVTYALAGLTIACLIVEFVLRAINSGVRR